MMPEAPTGCQCDARTPCWGQRHVLDSAHETRLVKLDAKTLAAFRALGRIGGKKGGPKGGASRMAKLTADERRALAKKAAAARWKRKRP